MNTKRTALKGLLILTCVLLASLFFGRTIQTITTAKVQKVSAARGKLEDIISVRGEIRFSQSEAITISGAGKLPLTVDRPVARSGQMLKKGDLLFTAAVAGFEDQLAQIKSEYDAKTRERSEETAVRLRLDQASEHNEYYKAMIESTQAYWNILLRAETAALKAGKEMPEDIYTWGEWAAGGLASMGEGEASDALRLALESYEARLTMDGAVRTLKDIYTTGRPVARTPDGTFEYIKKIDQLSEEIFDLMEQMLSLEKQKLALEEIRAPRDGWLTEFSLKAGDSYDGSKPAYSLSAPGEMPVLRCDISGVDAKKAIGKGMKARLEGSERELIISDVQIMADGKKYALIEMDEAAIEALGGLSKLTRGALDIEIIYKAQRTTTLIPISALREESGGKHFVYLIDYERGGLFSGSGYVARKREVTVIDTSARQAAIEDELGRSEIADREDRPLEDGRAVMEYID